MSKGTVICSYGEIGHKFYVVLKGLVGVKVPTEVVANCKDYFEILRYQRIFYKSIIKYKDNHSRIVKMFFDMFGLEII